MYLATFRQYFRFLSVLGSLTLAVLASAAVTAADQATISFQLDLTRYKLPGSMPPRVGVRGSVPPLSWERSMLLKDPNGAGLYSGNAVFEVTGAGQFVEYKFVIEDSKPLWELENEGNRVALLREGMTTLAVAQWNTPNPLPGEDLARLHVSASELRADLALLRETLAALHPGLHRYVDAAALASRWAELERSLKPELSLGEGYLLLAQTVAAIRCGHTWPNFWNQSALTQQALFDGPDKLPFACRWIDDALVVTGNGSEDDRFQRGTRILRLNGVAAGTIRDRLLECVKGDGANTGQRLAGLGLVGHGSFEALDAFLPVLFPPTEGRFRVEAQAPETDQAFTAEVSATDRRRRRSALEARHGPLPSSYDDLWSFRHLNAQTAYLRLGTFVTYKMKLDWKRFLRDAFQEMKTRDTRHLIVDIRGNEGGMDEVVAELVTYWTKRPFEHLEEESRLKFAVVPETLRPFLDTWDQSLFDLTGKVEPLGDGFYRWTGAAPEPRPIRPTKRTFGGTVWLLVDGANSSATFHLARLCRQHQLATLVGEETGGSRRGSNGGSMFFLRLPKTGLEVDIPVYGSPLHPERPDRGIEPELAVAPTAADYAAGRDAAIAAALNRIQAAP